MALLPLALLLSGSSLSGTPQTSGSSIDYGISVGQATGGAGGTTQVDISLLPAGQPVTALQFDIQFPNTALAVTVTAGSALANAQKTLATSNPAPGTLRILITGMNRNEIPGGVIASLSVQASAGNAPGLYSVQAGNIAASNASGTAVYLFSSSGGVTIPGPVIMSAVNGASYASGGVAPGEIMVIGGSSLGPATTDVMMLGSTGTAGTVLDTTRVLFDGIAAPMIYTGGQQISAIVPYELDGKSQTALQVECQGVRSAPYQLGVVKTAPGIFTVNSAGTGQGAVTNLDGSLNGPEHPASRGSIISIYGTGEGQTNPPGVDGYIVPASDLRTPVLPVAVLIDGQPAEVLYAGSAGDQVSGVFQVNVQVPATASTGNAVPVRISVGSNSSQNGVTIAIQ